MSKWLSGFVPSTAAEQLGIGSFIDKLPEGIQEAAGVAGNLVKQGISAVGAVDATLSRVFQTDISRLGGLSAAADLSRLSFNNPQSALSLQTPFTLYQYPSDLGGWAMKFTFMSYKRKGGLDQVVERIELPQVAIALPVPANLQESFAVNYNTFETGIITNKIGDEALKIIDTYNKGGAAAGHEAMKKAGGKLGEFLTGKGNGGINRGNLGMLWGLTLLDSIGMDGVKNYIQGAAGVIPNNKMALMFSQLGFRSFQFAWKFAPKSRAESETLRAILNTFKQRMLPSPDPSNLFLNYPDECRIEFLPTDTIPFEIKKCVVENISINYAPTRPAFFAETNEPVEIEFSVSVKEAELIYRDNVSGAIDVNNGTLNSALPPIADYDPGLDPGELFRPSPADYPDL